MKLKFIIIIFVLISIFSINEKIKALELNPSILYHSHVQNIGWQEVTSNGQLSGSTGKSLRLEAIKISLNNTNISGSITYQAHVQNIGWMNFVDNEVISGTTGQSLRMEAIRIELTGEIAEYYDIYYQTHVQNNGWLGWAMNGEESGSAGYGYRLEAIKIVLVKKGEAAPGETTNCYKEIEPTVTYNSHVQDIGWQNSVSNNEISGTTNQNRRIEGMLISLKNNVKEGNINYQAHVQNIGWQDNVSNGQLVGTTGQSLRLEAIRINLTGDLANYYDIYYQVHVQNVGWLGWAKNGEDAGSEGFGYRLEAIKIQLVKKGDTSFGLTGNSFLFKSAFLWLNNGTKNLYHTSVGYIGKNVQKIIDVSEHQGVINWNDVKNNDNVDGVILRLGYSSYTEDSQFAYNISELKRLGIPYGIYLFSYAENEEEALSESNFVLSKIVTHNLSPTLGIYYDLESWNIGSYIPNITVDMYDTIINTFTDNLQSNGYASSVYTYTLFANNKMSEEARNKITWIAQYNTSCQYTGTYKMWQFSSNETVSGISTRVDMNVWFN